MVVIVGKCGKVLANTKCMPLVYKEICKKCSACGLETKEVKITFKDKLKKYLGNFYGRFFKTV